jgi:hypothetical protein
MIPPQILSEGGSGDAHLSRNYLIWRVVINPDFYPNRCYEILNPPNHFSEIRFGLGWGAVLGGGGRGKE